MLRRGGAWLAAPLLVMHSPAAADCDPADAGQTPGQVTQRIDRYWLEPRHPGAYRALAGLGDPGRSTEIGGSYVPETAEQGVLLSRMLADPRQAESELGWPSFTACRLDYALSVAQARVGRFGTEHPYVRQWLRVQQAAFSVCRDQVYWDMWDQVRRPVGGAVRLPPAMPTQDAEIARVQREDRAYQAASSLFYRRDPAARQAFRAIAASASPHAHIARYMLAAIDAPDMGRFGTRPGDEARAQAALASARAILADPSLRDIHPLAQGLIGYLGSWTGDSRVRAAQVDATLDALEAPLPRLAADESARDRYDRAAADVSHLHGDFEDEAWWLTGVVPTAMTASRAMAEQAQRRDLAAWLLFPRSPFERNPWTSEHGLRDPSGRLHGYAEAKAQAERLPSRAWSAIRVSLSADYDPAGWPQVDALTAAARACPNDHALAAVAPFFYHQVRTAIMYPALDEDHVPLRQQEGFARALAQVEAWPWKDGQYYRGLVSDILQYLTAEGRLADARAVRDRLQPWGENYAGSATALLLLAEDEDHLVAEINTVPERGQPLLNLLSIEALELLARREDLAQPVRSRFARTAWTRLYALQRPIPARLDRLMRQLNPEITANWTSRPGASVRDRRLLLDVLRSPGLNIVISDHQRTSAEAGSNYADDPGLDAIDIYQHSDNNWWCAWQIDRHELTASAQMYQAFFAARYRSDWSPLAVAGTPAALGPLLRSSWLWRSRGEAEQGALADIACAPRQLAERASAWRGSGLLGGGRAGQDEALALAVRATRYGCQRQGGHGAYSRAPFELLHERFPASKAAGWTPFWFDCSHFTGGCNRPQLEAAQNWRYWAERRYWF